MRKLYLLTCVFAVLPAPLFYWLENNHNPQVTQVIQAYAWHLSTLPLVGHSALKPVTMLGYGFDIVTRLANLFICGFWGAIAVWSVFKQKPHNKQGKV